MAAFLHFSTSEVESGLTYAQNEHRVCLNKEMLSSLANQTGIRWYANGRRPGGMVSAKRLVLADLWEKHRVDSERRNAYSSAISHMFGLRSGKSRRRRARCGTAVTAAPDAPQSGVYGFAENGQGMFLFGNTSS